MPNRNDFLISTEKMDFEVRFNENKKLSKSTHFPPKTGHCGELPPPPTKKAPLLAFWLLPFCLLAWKSGQVKVSDFMCVCVNY